MLLGTGEGAMFRCRMLVTVFVLLTVTRAALAESPLYLGEPEDVRALARARAALSGTDLPGIAAAKVEAARVQLDARYKEFLAGRGTLDFLIESAGNLLEAERTVSERPADRRAALERYWTRMREMELVTHARYNAGRIPQYDYLHTQDHRLEAEGWLLAVEGAGATDRPGPSAGPWLEVDDPPKLLARARFETSRARPEEVARARVAALRATCDEKFREFLAGRGTLDFLLDDWRRLLEAECAVRPAPADQLAAHERYWLQTREAETVNHARYDAGRMATQDLSNSRYRRQEAELWLIAAAAKADRKLARLPGVPDEHAAVAGFTPKAVARMKWELLATTAEKLKQDKLDSACDKTHARLKEFLAGRGTLAFLLEAARCWVDSERALASGSAEQRTALERHWALLWMIDRVNRARYDAGRIPIQDLAQSHYYRLEAEAWLVQAISRVEK